MKNWIAWFLELYFHMKYVSNKDNIWPVETLPGVLLDKTKNFKVIKISTMAAQKLGQVAWYMVTGSIKGFLVMCFPKTKKNQVCKNSYFFRTILKKMQEQGVLGSLSSNDLNYCSTVNIASLEKFFLAFFAFFVLPSKFMALCRCSYKVSKTTFIQYEFICRGAFENKIQVWISCLRLVSRRLKSTFFWKMYCRARFEIIFRLKQFPGISCFWIF